MIRAVFLDAGPLSLVTQRAGRSPEVDACKAWVADLALRGVDVCVPEVTDFEVRRELLRAGRAASVGRLDRLKATARYLPLSTDAMLLAAELWAQSRKAGLPTADPKELDLHLGSGGRTRAGIAWARNEFGPPALRLWAGGPNLAHIGQPGY